MIDNTDINTLIVDTIMIDNENQAEFILKKLNEDIYYDVLNDILDAFSDQRLEGEEVYVVLPNDLIEGE